MLARRRLAAPHHSAPAWPAVPIALASYSHAVSVYRNCGSLTWHALTASPLCVYNSRGYSPGLSKTYHAPIPHLLHQEAWPVMTSLAPPIADDALPKDLLPRLLSGPGND